MSVQSDALRCKRRLSWAADVVCLRSGIDLPCELAAFWVLTVSTHLFCAVIEALGLTLRGSKRFLTNSVVGCAKSVFGWIDVFFFEDV